MQMYVNNKTDKLFYHVLTNIIFHYLRKLWSLRTGRQEFVRVQFLYSAQWASISVH